MNKNEKSLTHQGREISRYHPVSHSPWALVPVHSKPGKTGAQGNGWRSRRTYQQGSAFRLLLRKDFRPNFQDLARTFSRIADLDKKSLLVSIMAF